jgi:hypothetical protein
MKRATLISLPTEVRLQIAEYALEQPEGAGEHHAMTLPPSARNYRASDNLAILLVCRQFYQDFANIALQKTTFRLDPKNMDTKVHEQPVERLRHLRKLVIASGWSSAKLWQECPFNNKDLRLDVLSIVFNDRGPRYLRELLRRLRNVKIVRIILECYQCTQRRMLCQLIGGIYKTDHFCRYDATDAPQLGAVWFEPAFRPEDPPHEALAPAHDFIAQTPRPHMAEEDYMVMMKPKIDGLMEWLAYEPPLPQRAGDV